MLSHVCKDNGGPTLLISTILTTFVRHKKSFYRIKVSMETDLKKIVGQRLQLLRIENNLTQEQMGEKLHLSTSAYCKIEYGETDLTLTRLDKIAQIFNIPAVELFEKILGNTSFNCCLHFAGTAPHNNTPNTGTNDDLRELIKSNSRLIEMLGKRLDQLESRIM